MQQKSEYLWTNERHASFLSQMEASFVRRSLVHENDGLLTPKHADHLDLRRPIPDSSESTRELKHRSRSSNENPEEGQARGPNDRNDVGTSAVKTRRRSLQPLMDASQDQVVPQLGMK